MLHRKTVAYYLALLHGVNSPTLPASWSGPGEGGRQSEVVANLKSYAISQTAYARTNGNFHAIRHMV